VRAADINDYHYRAVSVAESLKIRAALDACSPQRALFGVNFGESSPTSAIAWAAHLRRQLGGTALDCGAAFFTRNGWTAKQRAAEPGSSGCVVRLVPGHLVEGKLLVLSERDVEQLPNSSRSVEGDALLVSHRGITMWELVSLERQEFLGYGPPSCAPRPVWDRDFNTRVVSTGGVLGAQRATSIRRLGGQAESGRDLRAGLGVLVA